MTAKQENFFEETRTLSGKQILVFNLPNLMIQAKFAFIGNIIILFYINIMGQTPIIIGVIHSSMLFFSAIMSVLLGALSDKISTRVGRKKTIMLICGPIVSVVFILIWIPPTPTGPYGSLNLYLIVWYVIIMMIWTIANSGFQASYLSMIPELSSEEDNRLKISVANMLAMIVGSGIGIFLPIILVGNATKNFDRGESDLYYPNSSVGREIFTNIFIVSIIFSVFFILAFIIMMVLINEPNLSEEHENISSIKDIFKDLLNTLQDKNYRNYILSFLFMFIAFTAFANLLINYSTFVLKLRGEEFFFVVIFIVISCAFSFILWDSLSKRLGLKKSMTTCLILAFIAFSSNLILIIPMSQQLKIIIGIALISFTFATFVGSLIFPMAIVSNIVDMAAKRLNKNVSGAYVGLYAMMGSLSAALVMLFISSFLQIFGTNASISYILIFFVSAILIALSGLIFRKVKVSDN
ncbi:MAG: MFS transporter [Candidatus Lokiarchaeota archaeon]|nr:MFS transporter [Candidatus Lokiarchaeota archaeon]MBD3341035.1 MFS transporter [Candidatus Lokiarchaeota archaeon]